MGFRREGVFVFLGGFYQMTSRGAALTIAHSLRLLKPTIQIFPNGGFAFKINTRLLNGWEFKRKGDICESFGNSPAINFRIFLIQTESIIIYGTAVDCFNSSKSFKFESCN